MLQTACVILINYGEVVALTKAPFESFLAVKTREAIALVVIWGIDMFVFPPEGSIWRGECIRWSGIGFRPHTLVMYVHVRRWSYTTQCFFCCIEHVGVNYQVITLKTMFKIQNARFNHMEQFSYDLLFRC